jgi:cysteinyl-tRNA synthetase
VKNLTEKGIAYWHPHDGRINAYFEPSKFKGFGKLAHLDMTRWPKRKRRFHKDTYPGTPWNRGDFIIWHGCKPDDVCWDTEIGTGRPAWNVQDAAIVTEHLGFHVEVAAGGIDNLVRHHDYTLAIAESISDMKFADFWLHGAHLFVNGSKMSKSKGNVIYPSDLQVKGYGGDKIRFLLIHEHYRKRLNFTLEKFEEDGKRLDNFKRMVLNLREPQSDYSSENAKKLVREIVPNFECCMNDDLDVKGAFKQLCETVSNLDAERKKEKLSVQDAALALEALRKVDSVLKVIF